MDRCIRQGPNIITMWRLKSSSLKPFITSTSSFAKYPTSRRWITPMSSNYMIATSSIPTDTIWSPNIALEAALKISYPNSPPRGIEWSSAFKLQRDLPMPINMELFTAT